MAHIIREPMSPLAVAVQTRAYFALGRFLDERLAESLAQELQIATISYEFSIEMLRRVMAKDYSRDIVEFRGYAQA